jgi:hypothetical protein
MICIDCAPQLVTTDGYFINGKAGKIGVCQKCAQLSCVWPEEAFNTNNNHENKTNK